MTPGQLTSIARLISKMNDKFEQDRWNKQTAVAQIVYTNENDDWGMRVLWPPAIVLLIGLAFFSGCPTAWKWLFGICAFLIYPICFAFSCKKDEYNEVDQLSSQIMPFMGGIFIASITLFMISNGHYLTFGNSSENSFSLVYSIIAAITITVYPYWLNNSLANSNIFIRLRWANDSEASSFFLQNEKLLKKKAYLYFYEAIIYKKYKIADMIYKNCDISFNARFSIKDKTFVAERFYNFIVQKIYSSSHPDWKEIFDYLEQHDPILDGETISIVADIKVGVGFIDKIFKTNDKVKLDIRKYFIDRVEQVNEISCSDCSGTGSYFDSSCPYCGGLGVINKCG